MAYPKSKTNPTKLLNITDYKVTESADGWATVTCSVNGEHYLKEYQGILINEDVSPYFERDIRGYAEYYPPYPGE